MRSAFCAALLCGAACTAAAQEVAVSFAEPTPVTLTGFAVGLASYDRNLAENTLVGSKLALSLFRPLSDQLYFFGQLTTHLEEPEGGGDPQTEVEIDNLIISWTPPGATAWNVTFGRFDAPIGFERDDEPLNLIPTNSFNFMLARPAKFTGAIARVAVAPTFTLAGYLTNGWNADVDVNSGKTVGLRAQLLPRDGLAIGLNAVYGPEEEGTNAQQRTLLAADATLQPVDRLIVGMELNRGMQRDAGASVAWTGAAVTVFWRLGRRVGLSARAEVLDDADGVTSGQVQTLRSITVSPWYFYREAQEGVFANVEHTTFHLPAFSVRPAIRIDDSSQPFFEDKDGALRRTNVSAVLELVVVF